MEHVPSMRDKSKAATLRSTGSLSDSPQSTRRVSYAHLGSPVRRQGEGPSRNGPDDLRLSHMPEATGVHHGHIAALHLRLLAGVCDRTCGA